MKKEKKRKEKGTLYARRVGRVDRSSGVSGGGHDRDRGGIGHGRGRGKIGHRRWHGVGRGILLHYRLHNGVRKVMRGKGGERRGKRKEERG